MKKSTTPIDLTAARKTKAKKNYAALVLKVWDDMDHEQRREFLEKRAEVQRKARQAL